MLIYSSLYRFLARSRMVIPALCIQVFTGVAIASGALEPTETLRAAAAMCARYETYRYDFTYEGTGSVAGSYYGTVTLERPKRAGAGEAVRGARVHARVYFREGDTERELVAFTDGAVVRLHDVTAGVVSEAREESERNELLYHIYPGVLFHLIQPDAFQFEITNGIVSEDADEELNGVMCRVVLVRDPFGADHRWYFGRDDFLPRGQEWSLVDGGVGGGGGGAGLGGGDGAGAGEGTGDDSATGTFFLAVSGLQVGVAVAEEEWGVE